MDTREFWTLGTGSNAFQENIEHGLKKQILPKRIGNMVEDNVIENFEDIKKKMKHCKQNWQINLRGLMCKINFHMLC